MKTALTLGVCVCGLGLGVAALSVDSGRVIAQSKEIPFQANRCYRIAFPITGAPNWKVLEVHDNGWMKAEVDSGPASAKRESAWVNSAQIVTARETRCSE